MGPRSWSWVVGVRSCEEGDRLTFGLGHPVWLLRLAVCGTTVWALCPRVRVAGPPSTLCTGRELLSSAAGSGGPCPESSWDARLLSHSSAGRVPGVKVGGGVGGVERPPGRECVCGSSAVPSCVCRSVRAAVVLPGTQG